MRNRPRSCTATVVAGPERTSLRRSMTAHPLFSVVAMVRAIVTKKRFELQVVVVRFMIIPARRLDLCMLVKRSCWVATSHARVTNKKRVMFLLTACRVSQR